MNRRLMSWGAVGAVVLVGAIGWAWILSLPPAPTITAAPPLTPGVDEVSLALVADAWSRTYRSRAVTFSRTNSAQQTRNGMRIVPDQVAASWPAEHLLPEIADRQPARALDEALHGIAARYGMRTADFVAMQLEYPTSSASSQHVTTPPR